MISSNIISFISDDLSSRVSRSTLSNQCSSDIVISLGSGTAVSEQCLPQTCLCLDKDRRSVYTASLLAKVVGVKSTFSAVFDIEKDDLLGLFGAVKAKCPSSYITVLFQHPNPRKVKTLQASGLACTSAMHHNLIDKVVLVFDHKPSGNCWNDDSLTESFFWCNQSRKPQFLVERLGIISKKGTDEVVHPVLGVTPRYGWALMKNSDERGLVISKM